MVYPNPLRKVKMMLQNNWIISFFWGGGQTKCRLKPKKTHIFLGGFLLAHQPKPSWNFVVVRQTPRELITGGTHDPPNDHRKGAHLFIQLIHAIQMVATATVLGMLDPGGVKNQNEGTRWAPISLAVINGGES